MENFAVAPSYEKYFRRRSSCLLVAAFVLSSGNACETLSSSPLPPAAQNNHGAVLASFSESLKVVGSRIVEVDYPRFASNLNKLGLVEGVSFGPGSGLRLFENRGSVAKFLYVTDRGPNSDMPSDAASKLQLSNSVSAKIFQSPRFSPRFGFIELHSTQGTAEVVDAITMKMNGIPLNGLPLPSDVLGGTNEIAFDSQLEPLKLEQSGMDPEAIDFDANGNVYVSEEYRPSILRIELKTGEVKEMWVPGSGLPEIFKYRRPNRGLEALAVTPKGDVVTLLQSTLSLPKEVNNLNLDSAEQATFIRGARRSAESGKLSQFAYPISSEFKKRSDAKIGDLTALSENLFLVIIQGKTVDGKNSAFIDVLDTSGACDLSGKKLESGSELEYAQSFAAVADICAPAKVTRLLNLADFGWKHAKTEGISLLNEKTIVVINDNDFGVGEEGPDAKTEMLKIEFNGPILQKLSSINGNELQH